MKGTGMIIGSLVLLAALPLGTRAQDYEPEELQAMEKLQFLLGRWEGDTWSRSREGERQEGKVVEIVESKLDGAILVLEGLGAKGDPTAPGARLAHHAFAVIHFDTGTGEYRMHSYKDGDFTPAALEVTGENRVEWSFDTPDGGRVRFQISLDGEGRWTEDGHYSPDGENWYPFFGMSLARVGE